MSDIAIRVEGLSKRYKIGTRGTHADELRGRLAGALTAPFQKLFNRNGESRVPSPESRAQNEEPSTRHEELAPANRQLTTDSHPTPDNVLWALRDVSFELKHGEILGIIGRNGAGKSTLLKILSRITEPTAGRVEMKGRLAALLEVGTGFHPELTGRENVYLNGSILGMTKAEIDRQFDAIVDFAGVERFIDTPVKRYSSGMHVRLGFAVAAHLQPELLLVDEVLAVGDAAFQKKCLGKMSEAVGSGRTVLFVSHNMHAIRQHCARAIWIQGGALAQAGDSEGVIRDYLHAALPADIGAETTFESDSAKPFQMRRVRLVNERGEGTDTFHCDSPIIVEMESISRQPISDLYGYFAVSHTDGIGTTVLVSDSRDVKPNSFDNLAPGLHCHRITIPPRILGPGEYRISASFASRHHDEFLVDAPGRPLATFTLLDLVTARGNNRGGYISTLLPWRPATDGSDDHEYFHARHANQEHAT